MGTIDSASRLLWRGLVIALVLGSMATRVVRAQQRPGGPEGQTALMYSDSTSFWVNVPRGWVLDAESGRRDGWLSVLYREGETWRTGDPVMYASAITPKSGFNAVVPAAVRADSARWGGETPDLVFAARDSIRTVSGAFAHIRDLRSNATHQYATVAYIQADARVWMVTLSARTLASHDGAYADFLSLVKSYAPGPIGHP